MNMKSFALPIIIAFLVAAIFGLYLPMMAHGGHDAHCLFSPANPAICAPLTHIEHWISALAATLAALTILGALCIGALYTLSSPHLERSSIRGPTRHQTARPTLFEELFADGILHRKEPHPARRRLAIT